METGANQPSRRAIMRAAVAIPTLALAPAAFAARPEPSWRERLEALLREKTPRSVNHNGSPADYAVWALYAAEADQAGG
jgi:hypothetical protein